MNKFTNDITLSVEQQAVVNHSLDNHARVLAGPGTGKSATAVALITKVLESSDPPPKIKFITFTRAATAELAKKLGATEIEVEHPSTFHSFSISILMKNPGAALFPLPLRIPSDYEYKKFIIPDLACILSIKNKKIENFFSYLSANWDTLDESDLKDITDDEKARFVGAFNKHRKIYGYTLLNELPNLLLKALGNHNNLQGIDYKCIVVDEYQDLNACEISVLRKLADCGATVIAIGDDDQSIYSFRHAHPEGIRRFLEEYATKNNYKLTICHRCGKSIIRWSQFVINGDVTRKKSNLIAADNAPDGFVKLLSFSNEKTEAIGVVKLIKWLNEAENICFSDILVLSRSDYRGNFTQPIKKILEEESIPVSNLEDINALLNEKSSLNLISILTLLCKPDDSLAWCGLLQREGGIGKQFIQHIYEGASCSNDTFGAFFLKEAKNKFGNLSRLASSKKALALYNRISQILENKQLSSEKSTKWGEWIKKGIDCGNLPPTSTKLVNLLIEIDNRIETDIQLNRFLSQISPLGKDLRSADSEGVRFMTMNSSKGLTVKATIVIGVENDLIPRHDSDIFEERRLLYVAMSRSTDYLFLTWANTRRGPTARSGKPNISKRRQPSMLLTDGPVTTEDGDKYTKSLN